MDDAEREARFLELLGAHSGQLQRIAWSYARGAERDDLYQEILCQLWRALPTFRGESSPGTWVYRVALNTALSQVRLRRRRPAVVAAESGHPVSAGTPAREEAILQEFLGSLGEIDRSMKARMLAGLLGALAAGLPARAKDQPGRSAIDRLARPLVEGGVVVGLVVGTLADGESTCLAYGETQRGSGRAPDADTVFEIGSVSKVFTALLLADGVERGALRLHDPVQAYLPP